jgi:hypothetical protein
MASELPITNQAKHPNVNVTFFISTHFFLLLFSDPTHPASPQSIFPSSVDRLMQALANPDGENKTFTFPALL